MAIIGLVCDRQVIGQINTRENDYGSLEYSFAEWPLPVPEETFEGDTGIVLYAIKPEVIESYKDTLRRVEAMQASLKELYQAGMDNLRVRGES